MFGFGKKKEPPQRPERARRSAESKDRKSQNLAQLGFLTGGGLGDDGDVDNLMGGMDVGDDDLEEELAMLLDGNSPRRPKMSPAKKFNSSRPSAGNATNFDVDNPALDEDDADDDLDDPELEAELGDILGVSTPASRSRKPQVDDDVDLDSEDDSAVPVQSSTMTAQQLVKLLEERLVLYEKAKSAADAANESAKSRRFTRGLKTLKEMLSKAKAGRVIDEADIPPMISVGGAKKEQTSGEGGSQFPEVPSFPMSSEAFSDPMESIGVTIPDATSPASLQNTTDTDMFSNKLPAPLVPTPAFVELPDPPDTLPKPSAKFQQEEKLIETAGTQELDPAVEVRLKEYKRAAVVLKRQGDVQGALKYLKLTKQLELRARSGDAIDISEYPTLESEGKQNLENHIQEESPASAPTESVAPAVSATTEMITPASESSVAPPGEDIFGAPPAPTTVMEALEQRLAKYKSEVEKANASSNSSKARRMGRIVKQYEEAISNYKKGKPLAVDELPTPPGFSPIPVSAPTAVPPSNLQRSQGTHDGEPTTRAQQTALPTPDASSVSPFKQTNPDLPKPMGFGQSPGSSGSIVSRGGKPGTKLTLQEKQLQIITLRQQQFREAALNAKKRGDINQAREFLRTAKGFDKLIQVAQAGLPVDMATLPSPPEAVARLETEDIDNFEVISASDCIMPSGGTAEVFAKLENDLKQQLKMCMRTRDHFKSIGDVASANRFESMALESKRDLDTLRLAMKKNSDLPKYHYENRIFSITECNTDIAEDEIEINIIQGVNYKVSNPADVDTYVRVELPYPSAEEAQSNKTSTVKDTNNPAYNATYKMAISRTARNFQRFVHRHGFKCEVWSKGGFLRGSTLIGTASVKLLPLETKCTLHDAFDVLDGRKSVGKLEVKVRIREPVLAKQITQKKEKWLSIDRS